MAKPDLLTGLGGRHHVADLDLAVADDHPVDQELHQRPPLRMSSGVQRGSRSLIRV